MTDDARFQPARDSCVPTRAFDRPVPRSNPNPSTQSTPIEHYDRVLLASLESSDAARQAERTGPESSRIRTAALILLSLLVLAVIALLSGPPPAATGDRPVPNPFVDPKGEPRSP